MKQEFIPSDVDEAEFEVSITAPQGASLEAMDEAMRAIEAEIEQRCRGVRRSLSDGGRRILGARRTAGAIYVRIAPHEERMFSLGALSRETAARQAADGVPGQLQPARRHAARFAPRLRKYPDLRISVRNYPRSTSAAATSISTSRIRGPELEKLGRYAERLRDKRAASSAASSTPTRR